MAPEPSVTFRVSVTGAPEASAEVEKLRTALGGVETSLDSTKIASQTLGKSQADLTDQEKAASAAVTGAVAPQISWKTALGDTGIAALSAGKGTSLLGDATRETHQALFEGARLTRSFVDALGQAVPGLSTTTGMLTRLSRETTGMSVGTIAAIGGALGLAAAIGALLSIGKQYVDTQNAANAAIRDMDFNAAVSGLKKAQDATADYADNWKRVTGELTTGNQYLDFLADKWSMVAIVLQKAKGGQAALTAEEQRWADASQKNFDLQERGKLSLDALTAGVAAEAASFVRLRESATSVGDLSATFDKEAEGIRRVADARANQVIQDALAKDIRLRNAGLTEVADQRMAEIASKASSDRAAAYEKADQVIVTGSKTVAADIAQRLQDEGRLAEITDRRALEAVKAGQAEAEAMLAAKEADAKFYGTAVTDLEAYHAERRAAIQREGDLEVQALTDMYEKERQAQLAKIGALQPGGLPQQAAYRQLEQLDATYNANLQRAAADTRTKLIQDATQATEGIRGEYQRRYQIAQQTAGYLVATGRAGLQAEIAVARQAMESDVLSTQQRQQAEVTYYTKKRELAAQDLAFLKGIGAATIADEIAYYAKLATDARAPYQVREQAAVEGLARIRKAEDDAFGLSKAQGRATEADALAHSRAIADSWKQGTQQRVDAEKKFATEAKQAWDTLVSSGRTLEDMAIKNLEAADETDISQAKIADEIGRIKQSATELNATWQQGGTLTKEQLDSVRAWSDANAKLKSEGQTDYAALRASATQLDTGVKGVVLTTDEMAQRMGVVRTAVEGVKTAFDGVGTAIGSGITGGLSQALSGAVGEVERFIEQVNTRLVSGTSSFADRIVESVLTRLRVALDAEAMAM